MKSLAQTITLLALAPALVATGCPGNTTLSRLEPDFVAEPGEVDFGTVVGGAVVEQPVVVLNAGMAAGEIEHLWLETDHPDLSFTWTDGAPEDDAVGRILEPSESLAVTLQFQPFVETPLSDTLVIENSAGEALRVPIVGIPNIQPVPDIWASPDSWDADLVDFGDSRTETFTVGNSGWAQLDVGSVVVSGAGSGHFLVESSDVSWQTIAEGEERTLEVTFAPQSDGLHEAVLELHSVAPHADPDENPLLIPLLGRGQGAPASKGPVAVCGPDIVTVPLVPNWLNGSDSFDPNGHEPLLFSWRLIGAPVGSISNIIDPSSPAPTLTADLAGDYVAELTVTNSIGMVGDSPCTTTITANPSEDLRVEMWWDVAEDIDLHLLRFEGAVVGSDDDCWALNCSPTHTFALLDWWDLGIGPEDPSLDIDDNTGYGTGPENTNIELPNPSNYAVVVHDYPSPLGTPTFTGTNTIHVNIWLGGELADTTSFAMPGDDDCYEPFIVNWPESGAGAPYTSPGRGNIGPCLVVGW